MLEISSMTFGSSEPPRPLAKGAYIASNIDNGRLVSPVRRNVDAAFVVIEASSIDGLTIQQIADFGTMLGLTSINT